MPATSLTAKLVVLVVYGPSIVPCQLVTASLSKRRYREEGVHAECGRHDGSIHDVKAGMHIGPIARSAKDLALVVDYPAIGGVRHDAAAERVSANQTIVGQAGPDRILQIGSAKRFGYLAHPIARCCKLLLLS